MNDYDALPIFITGKDLDYLSDMYNWNYGALKNVFNMKESVSNFSIKDIFEEGINLFDNNINIIMNILGGTNEK